MCRVLAPRHFNVYAQSTGDPLVVLPRMLRQIRIGSNRMVHG
jgi:hypothetical protein